MKLPALLVLASCGGRLTAECAPPDAFLLCDTAESPSYVVCWSEDSTDWVFLPDGNYIHENRVSQGAEGPMLTATICRGRVE